MLKKFSSPEKPRKGVFNANAPRNAVKRLYMLKACLTRTVKQNAIAFNPEGVISLIQCRKQGWRTYVGGHYGLGLAEHFWQERLTPPLLAGQAKKFNVKEIRVAWRN